MVERWMEFSGQRPWLGYVVEIGFLVLGSWLLKTFVIRWLQRWAQRTESSLDDALVKLLGRAVTPILLLAVLASSINLFPLSVRLLAVINRILYFGILTVVLYFGSKAAQLILESWLASSPGRESLRDPVQFLARVLFAAFGVMMVLDNLGVSLTAAWTTLGVGSLAVALALQDTLSNFFSGVYLRLDNPVRLGDYVKLDTGDEGFVIQMGWRSTRIRTLPNNVVVVPNGKLASSILTNFSLPDPPMSLLIRVGVSYKCDPEQVERILVDEATRAAGKIEGLLADPAPFVRFIPGFGDSSLDFTLICRVQTFVDQFLVQHELGKRIFARFRREGIEIPFPQRDVHVYADRPLAFAVADPSSAPRSAAERSGP